MKFRLVAILILGLLACGSATLFVVQNLSRTTQLSFDLQFLAWQLEQPVAIPILMGICLGTGLLMSAVYFVPKVLSLSSKVRRLERQTTLYDQTGEEWPTT